VTASADVDELSQRARAALAAGRAGEAAGLCRAMLAQQPERADALYLLGVCLSEGSDRDQAPPYLERAVALQPGNPDFRLTLAVTLFYVARFDEAADMLRALLAQHPGNARAHFMAGAVNHIRGKAQPAIVCYRRALACDAGLQIAADCLEMASAGLFFGTGSGWQGMHAPARQVFMSAAIDLLCQAGHRPPHVLEVGSYMGASALTWAYAIDTFAGGGTVTCVDTWRIDASAGLASGEMDLLLRRTDGAYESFLRNVGTAPGSVKIDHHRGASADVMPKLPAAAYDLVYIDGSHFRDDVAADIRNAEPLLRDGGLLCGDDLELQAQECDLDFARRHPRHDLIDDPRTGRSFHPGVTVAVAERLGVVSAYRGFWIVRKAGRSYEPVDLAAATGLLPRHWPRRIAAEMEAQFAASGELRSVRA
jgi:predicted O-methyltransferase YrrM